MRIVWDLDGTLLRDTGKDYDQPAVFTPLFKLLQATGNCENVVVTGRTTLPAGLKTYFDKKICRNWEPVNWDNYYGQYFQWKVDTILEINPDLVFDDDQQIVRYLTKKGISCVWTPEYAFMHDGGNSQ
jgi:hypothetical protein